MYLFENMVVEYSGGSSFHNNNKPSNLFILSLDDKIDICIHKLIFNKFRGKCGRGRRMKHLVHYWSNSLRFSETQIYAISISFYKRLVI